MDRPPAVREYHLPKAYPVYLVDDEERVREVLVELCAERGFECRGFADGEDFLRALHQLEPGCVLLDMRLPGMSGLQIQSEMVRRGRALPVVAITGHADADMAVASMKLGAVDFLEKPFKGDVLFEAVGRAFARLEREEASDRGQGTPGPAIG
jgi:two-component system response regulator FixJ